jgi:hypothetical protein
MQLDRIDLKLPIELVPSKTDDNPVISRGVAGLEKIMIEGVDALQFFWAYGQELASAPSTDSSDAQCSLYDLRQFTTTITATEKMPDLSKRLLETFNQWRRLGVDQVWVHGSLVQTHAAAVSNTTISAKLADGGTRYSRRFSGARARVRFQRHRGHAMHHSEPVMASKALSDQPDQPIIVERTGISHLKLLHGFDAAAHYHAAGKMVPAWLIEPPGPVEPEAINAA